MFLKSLIVACGVMSLSSMAADKKDQKENVEKFRITVTNEKGVSKNDPGKKLFAQLDKDLENSRAVRDATSCENIQAMSTACVNNVRSVMAIHMVECALAAQYKNNPTEGMKLPAIQEYLAAITDKDRQSTAYKRVHAMAQDFIKDLVFYKQTMATLKVLPLI